MKNNNHDWQRCVIKVGSSLIAPGGVGCSTQYLLALADFIHDCLLIGKEIVIVSSGSVAAGAGITETNVSQGLTIPEKQALAALGQTKVMQHWQRLFDQNCAQILLTRSDLESDKRLNNAKNTLEQLFKLGAIPIINENDSVVVDELVVGDNDNLAAKVAVMCNADRLIICSDVDGLYDKNPQLFDDAKLIREVEQMNQSLLNCASGTENPIAKGGMLTKLQAAMIASAKGVETWIVNGKKAKTFDLLKQNICPGTVFYRNQTCKSAVSFD